MVKSAFVGNESRIRQVFSKAHFERLGAMTELHPTIVSADEIPADTEVLISTWGMPRLTPAQADRLSNLKLMLYGAGDVRYFAEPLVERRVQIVSAWRANAIPVAEFTLSQILLSGKAYFRNVADYRATKAMGDARRGLGNFGETVALLGVGAVGRLVIEYLRPFSWKVIVFDPFLTDDEATRLGVEKVSLEDAFSQGAVVSNHLIDSDATTGMISRELMESMRPGATLINTGRGKTIDQDAFLDVFKKRKDLTALLDVTEPEPLAADSPIWDLENVLVSSHIAGASGNELALMADLCIEELERYLAGELLQHTYISFV